MGVCASHVCLMLPMSEKGDISPGVLGGCELKTASPLNHGVTSPALKGNSHRIALPSRIRFCYIWRLSTCPGLALSLLAHRTFPCSIFLLKKWTQPYWSLPPIFNKFLWKKVSCVKEYRLSSWQERVLASAARYRRHPVACCCFCCCFLWGGLQYADVH